MNKNFKKYSNSYAKVHSLATIGIEGIPIEVECVQRFQLPGFQIVGLPSASVREAKERVQSALAAAGYPLPSRKIIVNLAPAWLEKEGSAYDLAIAIACLVSMGVISENKTKNIVFLGELTLQGEIRATKNIFILPTLLRKKVFKSAILPKYVQLKLKEENLVEGGHFAHLNDVINFLLDKNNGNSRKNSQNFDSNEVNTDKKIEKSSSNISFEYIWGQNVAKRMLTIAAAGEHHAMLAGPRGIGKSLLASVFHSLLPPLNEEEKEIISAIYAAKNLDWNYQHPYRTPHSSVTPTALVGGGSRCSPGELSLAHGGVLFLDELLEFSRLSLERMRTPLENGYIQIARGSFIAKLPTQVYLLAATNLCSCGLLGDPNAACRCNKGDILHYQKRLSYALQDRIDLVTTMKPEREPIVVEKRYNIDEMKQSIYKARERMIARQGKPNGRLLGEEVMNTVPISERAYKLLYKAQNKYQLSTRATVSILRTALTIADLANDASVEEAQICEAISFKQDVFKA